MEQEIKKHTEKLVSEIRDTKKPVLKRLGGIFVEMLIIIFAVTFAAFIERSREHSHEQKEVKEFLLGLQTDLANDIKEMGEDRGIYKIMGTSFTYFSTSPKLDKDSLKEYQGYLWNTVNLLVNDGRFEGFKSSGKINTIENIALRNAILDLYQETVVALLGSTRGYTDGKLELRKMLFKFLEYDSAGAKNLQAVLQIPEIRNYCRSLRFVGEPIRRYDTTIAQSRRIIDMISKEYH